MSKQPTATNEESRSPEEVFIARMKRERERQGWSQQHLAAVVSSQPHGVFLHATAITKLEWALAPQRRASARNLRLNEALAIADALGLTLQAMLTDDDLTDARRELERLHSELSAALDLQEGYMRRMGVVSAEIDYTRHRILELTKEAGVDGEHQEAP
jgi:transcriptional regulator with XRE-family HTH domain